MEPHQQDRFIPCGDSDLMSVKAMPTRFRAVIILGSYQISAMSYHSTCATLPR